MKEERGEREAKGNDDVLSSTSDMCDYISSSEILCREHPCVVVIGVCPYCLNNLLMNLVNSESGEQRLSSSCSYRDSVDFGSVGRVSFLMENNVIINEDNDNDNSNREGTEQGTVVTAKGQRREEEVAMKKKSRGFWGINRLFRKTNPEQEKDYNDGKKMGISRSRSLHRSVKGTGNSGFNGGFGEAEPRQRSCFEAMKSNLGEKEHRRSNSSEIEPPRRSCFEAWKRNFTETEHRRSNFKETEHQKTNRRSNVEARKRNFSETEHRKSDVTDLMRKVVSMKEGYMIEGEEAGFIDLKFDVSSSSDRNKKEYSVMDNGGGGGGGSCRITANEREVKKSRENHKGKGWRRIFGLHQTAKKRDAEEEHQCRS